MNNFHLVDHDFLPGEHQVLLVVLQEDHHISLEKKNLHHDVLPGEHQALLVVLQEDHHISLERIPKKRAV